MSIRHKREQINRSIDSIFKLLIDIANEPKKYAENELVIEALKKQGKLCSLTMDISINNEQVMLRPLSLNTLRHRLYDESRDRNFAQLEKLRACALSAIQKLHSHPAKQSTRTRDSLQSQIEDLRETISSLRAANMVLIQALEINRRDLITISDTTNTGLRQKRISDAINRTISILNMTPDSFNDHSSSTSSPRLKLVPNETQNR